MENNTQQIIKKRLNELPQEIRLAIKNADLSTKFETIANRHSLNIDQNGSLQTETLLVMLGLEPSEDYVGNIEKELEISRVEAQSIAEEVNKEILLNIKVAIRTLEEKEANLEPNNISTRIPTPMAPPIPPTPPPPVSPIERAAKINIIPQPVSHSPQYNHENPDRDAVLHDLENIEKLQPKKANDFVEHLLANPVSNPAQTEVKKPAPPPTPRQGGVDPYREPF